MTRKSGTHLHVTYGALNSCFDLIRSLQQRTPCSPPLEFEPTTTVCRSWNSSTGPLVIYIYHSDEQVFGDGPTLFFSSRTYDMNSETSLVIKNKRLFIVCAPIWLSCILILTIWHFLIYYPMYIRLVIGTLVEKLVLVIWFNGISTLDSYLMPNPIYIWFLREQFVGNILKHAKDNSFEQS